MSMKIIAIVVLLAVSAVAGGSVFVKVLLSKIDNLETENSALVQSLKVEREKLEFEQQQNELAIERLTSLERSRKKAEENVEHLRKLYSDHDLEKLMSSKPKWMTKKFISATQEKLNELQAITH